MAYTLLVDKVERHSLALLSAAGVARALGGGGDLPDPWQMRDQFDTALAAAPADRDDDRSTLLRVLGFREEA